MPQKLAERAKYKRPKFSFGGGSSDKTPPGLPQAPAPKRTSGARPPRTLNLNIDANRKPASAKAPAPRSTVSNFAKGETVPVIKKQNVGGFAAPIKKQNIGAFSNGPKPQPAYNSAKDPRPTPRVTPKAAPTATKYKAAPNATPAATAIKKAPVDKNAEFHQAQRMGQGDKYDATNKRYRRSGR